MRWRWPSRRDAKDELADMEKRVALARREKDEVRSQTPEVRRLTDRLRGHLAENRFAERLYLQMIEMRR